MKIGKVPRVVIYRLSLYLRALNKLWEDGVKVVSSSEFGSRVGVKPAQLRKDLACFGQFGVKGRGYDVEELIRNLNRVLGTDRVQNVALVGVGNLGRALLAYDGFEERGFKIAAAFDLESGARKSAKKNVPIEHPRRLKKLVKEKNIEIGIITVPAAAAQEAAEKMIAAGIKYLLNFAPVNLNVPEEVQVENTDLAIGLEKLSYEKRNRRG